MRNTEPHYDEDCYLEERYGEEEMKTTEEMIEVMKAYEEGKEIEFRLPSGYWAEAIAPTWNWKETDYRVKAEPKYRPYNNIEELLKDWAEKTHSIPATMKKYVRPLIWVKQKKEEMKMLINGYDTSDNTVFLLVNWCGLEYLFNNYTYLDGSPCGIKE